MCSDAGVLASTVGKCSCEGYTDAFLLVQEVSVVVGEREGVQPSRCN